MIYLSHRSLSFSLNSLMIIYETVGLRNYDGYIQTLQLDHNVQRITIKTLTTEWFSEAAAVEATRRRAGGTR